VVTYKNGDKYEGDWREGVRHGNGTLWVFKGGKYHVRYSGEWVNDLPQVRLWSYTAAAQPASAVRAATILQ
jgi:hypothetical protein